MDREPIVYTAVILFRKGRCISLMGQKLYKLNKSNEPLSIIIHDEFVQLQSKTIDKIASAVYSMAGIVFSAVLTLVLQGDIDNIIPQPLCFPQWLWQTVCCTAIFLILMGLCYGVLKLFLFIKAVVTDKKGSLKDINELCRCFHKKVLNDIFTAISLEKKSCELRRRKVLGFTYKQDEALAAIYASEAVFYFKEAMSTMTDSQMFEPENDRPEYIDFITALDPQFLCYCFDTCIASLERIKGTLKVNPKASKNAVNEAILYYKNILSRIKRFNVSPVS